MKTKQDNLKKEEDSTKTEDNPTDVNNLKLKTTQK